ncbi:MAG: carbonic anhydrase [Ignavibacteriaceae bacterium]|nr:MAG: carbonic anhydrase [Chlorobiota bacterium]MBV6399241.1 Carbonic anhydrase 2 [Ignavibacteria bacterium]MCC6884914.1 carbonic anhydrase [Ignavibacteriales bacterium]MCE7953555.1 carbonic anhydrase [Chlorobi bacterium CHB7]MDL1887555.1 carbonic anhydrase [Ignavibacteria bacterium CHB1]MEB2329317.1 carbonic anhydrase [Ignavibacteriaceae bacterium]RIK49257.1 MAG: carbonic anhydrase [Ignavibacteriota bacterium]
MRFKKIFQNNEKWVSEKLSIDPDYFKKLSCGQNPEFLYIGCSDSRVTAEEMMGVNPGEVFVHRNIANIVSSTDSNLNAVVQFAVQHLKIKHIIVCGHYECGGVKSSMNPGDLGQLNSWLQSIRDVYRLHQNTLDKITNQREKFDKLVELNVVEQCINIAKIDHVQRQWYKTGFPTIHGWVFNIRTGKIIDLELNMDVVFADIRSIYDLKPHKKRTKSFGN